MLENNPDPIDQDLLTDALDGLEAMDGDAPQDAADTGQSDALSVDKPQIDDAGVEAETEDTPDAGDDGAGDPPTPDPAQIDESLRQAQRRAQIPDAALQAMDPAVRRGLLERLREQQREYDRLHGRLGSMQQQLEQIKPPQSPANDAGTQNAQTPPSQPQGQAQGPFPVPDLATLEQTLEADRKAFADEFGDQVAEQMVSGQRRLLESMKPLVQGFQFLNQQAAQAQQSQMQQAVSRIEAFFESDSVGGVYGQGRSELVAPELKQVREATVRTAVQLLNSGVAPSLDEGLVMAHRALHPSAITSPPPTPSAEDAKKAQIREKRRASATIQPNSRDGAASDPLDEITAALPSDFR